MRAEEFEQFAGELKQLCASLGKPYTDPLAQAYWRALRDVSLDEVQLNVERLLLNATKETRFPRPAQLRTTPPERRTAVDPGMKEIDGRAIRNLEELRQKDPDEWIKQVAAAKGADCNAIRLHRQFGPRLWYDLKEWCWRV